MAIDKLGIASEMAALDGKDREFYDSLSEEEKKKFTTFLMLRWGSCVSGSSELQAYYLLSTNAKLNKDYFAISDTKHKKLNWLTVSTISPGMGNMRHQWLAGPKRKSSNSKISRFFADLYPDMKEDDIAVMEEINDLKSCKAHAEKLGWTKEQIKKALG